MFSYYNIMVSGMISFKLSLVMFIQLSDAMFADENDQNTPLLISETDEEGTSATMNPFARIKGVVEDGFLKWNYKQINESEVSLVSVKLVQWENETKNAVRNHCDAEIVNTIYFRFNWKREQCNNWVKQTEGHQNFHSLQVEYMLYTDLFKKEALYFALNGHKSKREAVTYDLWKSELFPPNIVEQWIQGKGGHFWLDHNCLGWIQKQLLFEHEHQEVGCLVKPGAMCSTKIHTNEHNPNRNHQIVLLSSVKLVQWDDARARKQVVGSTSCVADIVEGGRKFIFNWNSKEFLSIRAGGGGSSKQNIDERFLTLQVEYYEEGVGGRQHSETKHFRHYDLWNTVHFPADTVDRWLQGKGDTFVLDHNCEGQQFFEQHEQLAEGEVLCLAKPGSKCPLKAGQQIWVKNPFEMKKYPRIEKFVELRSVKLIQWENKKGREVGSREWEEEDAKGRGIINSSLQSNCEAIIEKENYVRFNWEKCRPHFAKDDQGVLKPFSLQVKYKYEHDGMDNLKTYRYDLWDNELYKDDFVKEWFQGKGQFWLDHNKYPRKMFSKFLLKEPPISIKLTSFLNIWKENSSSSSSSSPKEGMLLVKPRVRLPGR